MAANDLPPEVNRLIDHVIGSMDHVEILRHLHLAPGDGVTADDMVARVHVDRAIVERIFRELEAAGIVRESDGAYLYAPVPRDRDAIVALVEMYNTRPVTLVRAIYARPTPLKLFSDAFRLRRDE